MTQLESFRLFPATDSSMNPNRLVFALIPIHNVYSRINPHRWYHFQSTIESEDLFFLLDEGDTRTDSSIEHLSKFTSDFYYVYRKGSNSCKCGTVETFSNRLYVKLPFGTIFQAYEANAGVRSFKESLFPYAFIVIIFIKHISRIHFFYSVLNIIPISRISSTHPFMGIVR